MTSLIRVIPVLARTFLTFRFRWWDSFSTKTVTLSSLQLGDRLWFDFAQFLGPELRGKNWAGDLTPGNTSRIQRINWQLARMSKCWSTWTFSPIVSVCSSRSVSNKHQERFLPCCLVRSFVGFVLSFSGSFVRSFCPFFVPASTLFFRSFPTASCSLVH